MKTNTWTMGVLGGLVLMLAAAGVFAQSGVVSIYKLDGLMSGTTVRAGENLRFLIRFNNNTIQKCNVSNGFKLSSPDGATWDSTTIDSIGPVVGGEATYFIPYFDIAFAFGTGSPDGMGEDTVGMIGAGNPNKVAKQLPVGFNDSVFAITAWFNGDRSSAGKHICIDSSFWGVGGTWVWVGKDLTDYFPPFQGLTPSQPYSDGLSGTRLGSGYCFDIYAPLLGVSTTQLTFTAQEGTGNPASQSFSVSSTGDGIGDHLNFTLFETSTWLNKSPSSGTTPRSVLVSVNTTGLLAGTYTDSIRVESSVAGNSPLYVRVILEITSPAPTIAVNKSSLSFVGLQGGSDPAPQTFIVKNVGGGSLLWTVTHVQPWLNLAPASGIDSTLVTASVSVIGLPTGEFYDTITVSDPAATNNPVLIPVRLSLGSSLPSIVVDSPINHILLQAGSSLTFSRKVYVRNGGVGSLTYSVSETSDRIQSIAPMSGAAPESVQVNFKVAGISNYTYTDTIWVSSPEAVNSPYPVVFRTRIVDSAASLSISRDTIKFLTYLCTQGPTDPMPTENFFVYNAGGDNPMIVDLLAESEFFELPSTSQEATAYFLVQAVYADVPAGVYYDTILVTTEWAVNSPQMVIVRYERSAGTQWEFDLALDSLTVTKQEHTGPAGINFKIENKYPGCLNWSVDEEIPWFTPVKTSGTAPEWFNGLVEAEDLTLGTYRDSIYLLAPGAVNSPRKIIIIAKIWRFYGDCNWNGFVDVVDLSWLIAYLTEGQPFPQPELLVGDVTCNEFVDLTDLSSLVSYLTNLGTHLCGNP